MACVKHCCCAWCGWCLIQYKHNINISLFHCTPVCHNIVRFVSLPIFAALRVCFLFVPNFFPCICSFSIRFYFILWQIFHSIEIEAMLKMQLNFHATISFVVFCFDSIRFDSFVCLLTSSTESRAYSSDNSTLKM